MSVLLIVALGLVGFLAAVLAYESALAALRLIRDDGRLRLREVTHARGLAFRPPATLAALSARALAVRRCVACPRQGRCDEIAAGRDWPALGAICPNTPYLDSLRAG